MRYYRLTPLDTLFFRDGSPFEAGETGQMEVRGSFPPNPATVAGALRAAFARQLGWDGRPGNWDASIIRKLGKGDDPSPLRFSGPYLARDREPLFPAPLYLLGAGGTERFSRLEPGEELETDKGVVRLPEAEWSPDAEGQSFKPLENAYLTPEAMRDVLNGGLPESSGVVPAGKLWGGEARVGIRRDKKTRTTGEDDLYQTVHTRLERNVGLVMGVDGYDGDAPATCILGGESRMAGLKEFEHFTMPEAPGIEASGGRLRYTVTLITPARLGEPDLPGKIESACVGKPVLIGGWDSTRGCPKDLEPYLPAGSTWFMEAGESDKERVLEHHGAHIGEKTEWGYGRILIGAWR